MANKTSAGCTKNHQVLQKRQLNQIQTLFGSQLNGFSEFDVTKILGRWFEVDSDRRYTSKAVVTVNMDF